MSSYPRGVVDGVVHYCDVRRARQFNGGARYRTPWCQVVGEQLRFATSTLSRREMVTCLRCLGIRRQR